MPGKHNAGGCGCCGCWDCVTSPDTVQAVADAISGNLCCNYPNGTFTVGSAATATLESANGFTWDESTHTIGGNLNTECAWTWYYKQNQATQCTTFSPRQMTFSGGTSEVRYVEVCEVNDELDSSSNVAGQYAVVLKECMVHVQWWRSVRRITVVIKHVYQCYICDSISGTGPGTHFIMTIYDEYTATDVDCNSLPTTISLTARYVSGTKSRPSLPTTSITTDSVTYGYNPADATAYNLYTYYACPALASVDLTYA